MKYDLNEDTEILRLLAEKFPKDSREYRILEDVALAYIFSKTFHEIEFAEFKDLNSEEIESKGRIMS